MNRTLGITIGTVLTLILGVVVGVALFDRPGRPSNASTPSSTSQLTFDSTTPLTFDSTTSPEVPAGPVTPAVDPVTPRTDSRRPTQAPPYTRTPTAEPSTTRPVGAPVGKDAKGNPVPRLVADTVAKLTPYTFGGQSSGWLVVDAGHYDPAAALSAVIVQVAETGDSPEQVLLFHGTRYLGRGTSRPVVFAEVTSTDPPAGSVGVRYRWDHVGPVSDLVFANGQSIGFCWNGSRAVMEQTLSDAAYTRS